MIKKKKRYRYRNLIGLKVRMGNVKTVHFMGKSRDGKDLFVFCIIFKNGERRILGFDHDIEASKKIA